MCNMCLDSVFFELYLIVNKKNLFYMILLKMSNGFFILINRFLMGAVRDDLSYLSLWNDVARRTPNIQGMTPTLLRSFESDNWWADISSFFRICYVQNVSSVGIFIESKITWMGIKMKYYIYSILHYSE